jgi:hypothetical protein
LVDHSPSQTNQRLNCCEANTNLQARGSHGGWVAEPIYPSIEYFLKDLLFQEEEYPGAGHQFWLGAYDRAHEHDEHEPGDWYWPHNNLTVDWFDWANGQPNDLGHHQNCITLLEFSGPIGVFRDFFWNDHVCDDLARPICERPCDDCNSTQPIYWM